MFEYTRAGFMIDHFKDVVSLYWSFTSHANSEKVTSFIFPCCQTMPCHYGMAILKFASANPRYTLPGLMVVEAMNLYMISLVWHLTSIGQSLLFLQLHWSFAVIFSLITFSL